MDRLIEAGLPSCLHRLSYCEQRRLIQDVEIFQIPVPNQMMSFYRDKIEDAMKTIDADGRRDWWS